MKSTSELIERFKAEGLKVTPQRLAVFNAIEGDLTHPTAETIWERVKKQMPTVSLRTVYQALNDLVQLGEVQAVEVGGGSVKFDPNITNHDHFVCTECNSITDVAHRGSINIASNQKFEIESTEVVFKGKCENCLQK